MASVSQYTLLDTTEYAADLIDKINHATTRIHMVALVISEDSKTRGIIDALCRASERGVSVEVATDIYFTFREIEESASWLHYLRTQTKAMRSTKKRLETAGAKVHWLGQHGLTFISRRVHVKWSVIDDTTYSFGGINIYAQGLTNIDYMFRVTDARIADELVEEQARVVGSDRIGTGYASHVISRGDNDIIIDGGRSFDSQIYRRVRTLAKQATAVTYVSQYPPSGSLRKLLLARDTMFYFNNWRRAVGVNRLGLRIAEFLYGVHSQYKHHGYLHAKCMLFTMADGSKVAVSGSHNFLALNGAFGAREIVLETRDPTIISQLETFIANHVA